MDDRDELRDLRQLVAQLTRRVYRLEQRAQLDNEEIAAEPVATRVSPAMRQSASTPVIDIRRGASRVADSEGLERRIGSQWLNRVGIIAVLIGVAYFLKFAIDNRWIGPSVQVGIGLFAGVAVFLWSERFRTHGYVLFSYSLKAVGIGILYLSLWASVYLYALVPLSLAFAGMILVTAATAFFALRQNAEPLAAMALVGGYLTPLALWFKTNHDIELFGYLLLLAVASLWMATVRGWPRLLFGGFLGTLIVYIAWYAEFFRRDEITAPLVFVVLAWTVFAAGTVLTAEDRSQPKASSSRAVALLALLNAAFCFVELYAVLDASSRSQWNSWAALLLACAYLVLAWVLNGRRAAMSAWLHFGVAAAFVAVFIAMKFNAHWIIFGWLSEAAALAWLAQRMQGTEIEAARSPGPDSPRANLLTILSFGAVVLAVARLLWVSDEVRATLVLNERFAGYVYAIAVMLFIGYLRRPEHAALNNSSAWLGVAAINVLALLAFHFELRDHFDALATAVANTAAYSNHSAAAELRRLAIARSFTYSAVWMIYGALLMLAGFWKRWALLRWQAIILIAVTIVKVFTYDVSALDREYRIVSFIALGVILLAISFLYQRDILKLEKPERDSG